MAINRVRYGTLIRSAESAEGSRSGPPLAASDRTTEINDVCWTKLRTVLLYDVCSAQNPLGLSLALGLRHILGSRASQPKEIIPTTTDYNLPFTALHNGLKWPPFSSNIEHLHSLEYSAQLFTSNGFLALHETVKTNDAMTGSPESQTGNRFPFHSTGTAANQRE